MRCPAGCVNNRTGLTDPTPSSHTQQKEQSMSKSISPERREAIIEQLRLGVAVKDIAADVGVCAATVRKIRDEIGLTVVRRFPRAKKPVLVPDVIETIDAVLAADDEIVIPASAEDAEARLAELGPLATAVEWERACIVYALTKPGSAGRPVKSASFSRLTFSRFAAKGIFGLRNHSSVARYWYWWQRAVDDGVVPEVKLGDHVKLPEVAFSDYAPENPSAAETVTEAVGADPRAVANQAYAVLKEQRDLEEERNQALRDAAYEEDIQSLLDDKGWTREQAEEFVAEERRPFEEAADRKAKQAEVRKILGLAEKIEANVNVFVAAVADDSELLGVREAEELAGVQEVLERVMTTIGGLQIGRTLTMLDEEES
jgi:hypothetical protein